jgi:hypothetical protein
VHRTSIDKRDLGSDAVIGYMQSQIHIFYGDDHFHLWPTAPCVEAQIGCALGVPWRLTFGHSGSRGFKT